MASTYTPAGIELIADGEQSNTWGQTSNTNFELLEEMITGIVSIALASTSYTLTTTDGATSNGRHAVVVFTGSPGGTCTVTVSPNDMQKVYFIVNNTDQTVTMTQGSGGNVSVATGKTKVLYCDGAGSGAEVVDVSNGFDATTLADLGVTASAAELNIMDGVTSTTAELNILDGVTATAAELNILDGVTATAAELNILDGVTATAAELNILDGVTANASEINKLDGLTASTTELNYVTNVTSAIQTQLDAKAAVAGNASQNFSAQTLNATTANVTTIDLGDWTITQSGSSLVFSYGGSARFQLTSAGELTVEDDVVGFGSL
jgi:hypothetical protein